MARAMFLVPMTGIGTREIPFSPKYADTPGIDKWAQTDYSSSSVSLMVVNAPSAVISSIASNPDATILATPQNIDSTVTVAQANALDSLLEGVFIPGNIVSAGDTRRAVIRRLIGIFWFSQRMNGRFGQTWVDRAQANGLTLGTQWQDFPQALKNQFLTVRDSFGLSNAGLNNTSTVREIFAAINVAFSSSPMKMGGIEI